MSSGDIWEVQVSNTSDTYYNPWDVGTPNYQYYSTFTWPQTIYKYQISCPKCNKFNWLELDKIVECTGKKCGAKLKAVSTKADYEVAVDE